MIADAHFGSIFSVLQRHAARQPDTPAVIRGDLTLTYADLLEQVGARAAQLLQDGFRPGEMTGVALPNEIDNLIFGMALLCAGIPQISLGSHEPAANKQALIRKAGIARIIAPQAEGWMEGASLYVPKDSTKADLSFLDSLPTQADVETLILFQTTSGTTNIPKAFGLGLDRLFLVAKRVAGAPEDRRVLRTSSMEFDATRGSRMCALMAGNTCVFAQHIGLSEIVRVSNAAEVTAIHIGTYRLASLLHDRGGLRESLPSFTRIVTGGARVPGSLRHAVQRQLTPNLYVTYATSEAGQISMATPDEHEAYPEGVGTPMAGVTVEILGPSGDVLPDGEIGEARVHKPGIPSEYLGDPAASSAMRDGWFVTRDLLSRVPDGPLVFHGRVDDMMILGGINIYPSAIEDLLESHPDVQEAVAYPIKSRIHGEIPVAAVVLKNPGRTCDTADLLTSCRQALGLRSPRQIFVVDAIPRNSAGKPLRRDMGTS